MNTKVIIGIVAGGGVGFAVGALYQGIVVQNFGSKPSDDSTAVIAGTSVGACVGAGVGYYIATK
jgi:hypothetical protein